MATESSRELYQRLLRGEVPASAYTDAVKREVQSRSRSTATLPFLTDTAYLRWLTRRARHAGFAWGLMAGYALCMVVVILSG